MNRKKVLLIAIVAVPIAVVFADAVYVVVVALSVLALYAVVALAVAVSVVAVLRLMRTADRYLRQRMSKTHAILTGVKIGVTSLLGATVGFLGSMVVSGLVLVAYFSIFDPECPTCRNEWLRAIMVLLAVVGTASGLWLGFSVGRDSDPQGGPGGDQGGTVR